ncbi:NifU family protein [Formicincola oecophyllae]|uniref:NifU family protein n=1 Tax=Formicincola oecophyllae TaxID=2558361 RepID=A0A4Y6U8S3_9PROT|nr:NifU family protein [Formicincola oecophyllae]QDH13604.1 NifU family protein [Formicincola oecophyllae]
MLIEVEETPNPESLKFRPGVRVALSGSADFVHPGSAEGRSPLAVELFSVPGVQRVFLGADLVAVTKSPTTAWDDVLPFVMTVMTDFFATGQPALTSGPVLPLVRPLNPSDKALVAALELVLAHHVRPMVARDGGDVAFRGYDQGTVYLTLMGACTDCPSAQLTLKGGVERILKQHLPTISTVVAVEEGDNQS